MHFLGAKVSDWYYLEREHSHSAAKRISPRVQHPESFTPSGIWTVCGLVTRVKGFHSLTFKRVHTFGEFSRLDFIAATKWLFQTTKH